MNTVNSLTRDEQSLFENGHAFCYIPVNAGQRVVLGIRKSGLKRLLLTEYEMITVDATYRLAEKIGNNVFYFCVTGEVDGQTLLIEENWSGNFEVKVNRRKLAYIKQKPNDFTTSFQIDKEIDSTSSLFGVIVLFSFMVCVYKKESIIIDALE